MINIDDINQVVANSFKNFHVRGFDYLCLKRTPALTVKVYLFRGVPATAPEVVNPHDHRYHFRTYCLAGAVTNFTYARGPGQCARVMQEFEWRTPLNGGNGFTWKQESLIHRTGTLWVGPGGGSYGNDYHMSADELHTIQIHGEETVLMLHQYGDLPDIDATSTFTASREPPDISGCYERFTADEVVARLRRLEGLL
jgi:hypothetical protein